MKEVFCTRPLNQSFIDAARDKGINITTQRSIEIVPVLSGKLLTDICDALNHPSLTLLFTSKNAVAIFMERYAKKIAKDYFPSWTFFCISGTTKATLLKYFKKEQILSEAKNADALAKEIKQSSCTQPIHFFCGNRRHDTLPDFLKQNNIAFKEWIIYTTENVLYSIKKDYQAYLFYSPSAVESFFTKNNLPGNVPCFAIGDTTAAAIKKKTTNDILISTFPDTTHMLQALYGYFKINE